MPNSLDASPRWKLRRLVTGRTPAELRRSSPGDDDRRRWSSVATATTRYGTLWVATATFVKVFGVMMSVLVAKLEKPTFASFTSLVLITFVPPNEYLSMMPTPERWTILPVTVAEADSFTQMPVVLKT